MNINTVVIVKYNPILVNEIVVSPNMSAFMLNKFLIVNWSKGLVFHKGKNIMFK